MSSVATVVARGYGTFSTIAELPTKGYATSAEESEVPSETVETSFPTDRVGGGKAGWNRRDRRREQIRRDEEEFLEIIKIAMPEIMKYLK